MTSTVQENIKNIHINYESVSKTNPEANNKKSTISTSPLTQLSDKCLPLKKRRFVANFWIQLQMMQKNDWNHSKILAAPIELSTIKASTNSLDERSPMNESNF